MTRDFRSAFEVYEVELLGKRDVIDRREVELRQRRFALCDFDVRIVAGPARGLGMRHVWDAALNGVHLFGQRREFLLDRADQLAKLTPFFLLRLALGRILGLADALGHFVRLPIQLFDFGLRLPPRGV